MSSRQKRLVRGVATRRSVRLTVAALVCALGVGLVAPIAGATPIGPVQPGPPPLTGVSFVPSGDIGLAGGLQYAFSGVPTVPSGQFQTLEWGPTGPTSVKVGLDSSAHVLTFDV